MLEKELVKLLIEKKLKIATVESCSGGLIASSIASIPHSSMVFEYGFVTYSENAKNKMVGVSLNTIEQFDVVSSEVALEMAIGGQKKSKADIVVSVTGYADGGGNEISPSGTIWFGFYILGKTFTLKQFYTESRNINREKAKDFAIKTVYDWLVNN